jgi:pimeloyl-ACP methyl ester carboxylesterase
VSEDQTTAFVELGQGRPLVLIPGIQGRWEWMRAAVDALANRFRVLTFSLAGEPGSGPAPRVFDRHLQQVDAVLGRAAVDRAVICGVSYGGLVAVRYAARRPARVDRLVLVSTPAPGWQPNARVRQYADAPRSSALAFVAGAPARLSREIAAAIPGRAERLATTAGYLGSIVRYPGSARRMAARVRCLDGEEFTHDASHVAAPTLIITGEAALDRVVPVRGTREYLGLIRGAVGVTLENTGHIGLVTRPAAFADLIGRWCSGLSLEP